MAIRSWEVPLTFGPSAPPFIEAVLGDRRLRPFDLCVFAAAVRCAAVDSEPTAEAVRNIVIAACATPHRLPHAHRQRFEQEAGLFLVYADARRDAGRRLAVAIDRATLPVVASPAA